VGSTWPSASELTSNWTLKC